MNMSLGIILTPDNRSKAYIQKILKNNLKFDYVLFMNDNRIEKKYSDEIINTSKKFGFDISKYGLDQAKEEIIRRFDEEGIEFAYPTQTINLLNASNNQRDS